MKHSAIFIVLAFMLTGCILVDDNCHYETWCNYSERCDIICDYYGYNCVTSDCYYEKTNCWDEYICVD